MCVPDLLGMIASQLRIQDTRVDSILESAVVWLLAYMWHIVCSSNKLPWPYTWVNQCTAIMQSQAFPLLFTLEGKKTGVERKHRPTVTTVNTRVTHINPVARAEASDNIYT